MAAFSDLNMLVGPGGQERTVEQYGELLRRAGLTLARVVPTAIEVSIVEARLADSDGGGSGQRPALGE